MPSSEDIAEKLLSKDEVMKKRLKKQLTKNKVRVYKTLKREILDLIDEYALQRYNDGWVDGYSDTYKPEE